MSTSPQSRLPFIDVLRSIAIGTVLFRHLPPELGVSFGKLHEWGGRGVDLFFILSGFLIGTTSLERAARYQDRSVRQAGAYWLLRSSRIFPLYFTLLALFAIGLPIFHQDVTHVIRNYPLPFLTFTSNYLAQGTLELGIYWSLAIEEQFYLAVGLLVLLTARRRDTLESAFLGLSLVTIAVCVFYRWEINRANAEGTLSDTWYVFRLFHSTLARMDQLAIGLTTAVVASRFNATRIANWKRFPELISWAAVAAGLSMFWYPHRAIIGFFHIGVVFAVTTLIAQRPVARGEITGWRKVIFVPLMSIGKLSFGLYLFHALTKPAVVKLVEWMGLPNTGLGPACAFYAIWLASTWVIAWVSYRYFEDPIVQFARKRATRFLEQAKKPASVEAELDAARISLEQRASVAVEGERGAGVAVAVAASDQQGRVDVPGNG